MSDIEIDQQLQIVDNAVSVTQDGNVEPPLSTPDITPEFSAPAPGEVQIKVSHRQRHVWWRLFSSSSSFNTLFVCLSIYLPACLPAWYFDWSACLCVCLVLPAACLPVGRISPNPVDVYVRVKAYPSPHSPKLLNGDVAGTVTMLGENCSAKYCVGYTVFVLASDFVASTGAHGTYATHVNVREELVHKLQEQISWG